MLDPRRLSGHLMSTAEVEAALMVHPAVAEAAVVSRPHQLKGECLYCFVTLKNNKEFSQTLAEELKKLGKTGTEGGSSGGNVGLNVCVGGLLSISIESDRCYYISW